MCYVFLHRCIRFGFVTLDHTLLLKHVDLENALNNIYLMKGLMRENESLIASSPNFQELPMNSN